MNNQEAFNKIWERAKDHREAKVPITKNCKYRLRTEEGETLKCFVGALIPDELYDSELEGLSISNLLGGTLESFEPLAEYFKGISKSILIECQWVHDLYKPKDWEGRLREVAQQYSLEIPGE